MKNLVGLLLIALVVLLVRDASAGTQPCEITGIPNGTKIWSVLGQSTLNSVTVGNISAPQGVAIDPATGTVLVTSSGTGVSPVVLFNGTAYLNSNQSGVLQRLGASGTCSGSGFSTPEGAVFSSTGVCYIADSAFARVLGFPNCAKITPATFNATQVIGQASFGPAPACNPGTFTQPTLVLAGPRSLAYDSGTDSLFIADFAQSLVFVIKSISTAGSVVQHVSQYFGSIGASGAAAGQLNGPTGVAYDATSGALYIADFKNNFVLKFNNALTGQQNGSTANVIFGQDAFSVTTFSKNSSGFNSPFQVFVSSSGTLFVTDYGNNRVLGWNNAATITANDSNATFVLGQPNFVTNTSSPTGGEGFFNPAGIYQSATTPVGSVTLVTDSNNNRVVVYLCKASTSITTSNSASTSFSNSLSNSISTSNSGSNSISTSNSGSNSISTSNSGSTSSPASKSGAASKAVVSKSVAAASSKVAGSSVGSASVSLVIFKCHRPCRNACNVCAAIGGTCKNVGNGKYQCVSPRSAFAFRYQVPGRQTCPPTNGKPHLTALCKAAGGTFSCLAPRGHRRADFTIVTCSKP